MVNPAVSRRLLVAGGLGAGGVALVGVLKHEAHGSATPAATRTTTASPRPTAAPAATRSESATPSAPTTVATPRTPAELSAKLEAYGRSRGATFSVALRDRRNRAVYSLRGTWRSETLSIVKVLIMATVLHECQERGTSLTPQQVGQASAMITRSDNDAADALLTWVGVAEVREIAKRYGLASTVIQAGTEDGEDDWWGYSTTTALDQLRLLTGLLGGSSVLSTANRNYLTGLMGSVTPPQRWGICTPPLPTNVRWTTKNGWGGREDGYRANSIGHISGNGRDYEAVVLSRTPRDRAYARDTVSGISQILYDAMASPLH